VVFTLVEFIAVIDRVSFSLRVSYAEFMHILVVLLLIPLSSSILIGVDISHVQLFESNGVIYRDEQNQEKDLFQLMQEHHIRVVTIRLFTGNEQQAQADPYNYGNTLHRTMQLARRIKAHGLQFMLDFHYSDTWADPGKQKKPSTWSNLTFDQLVLALHDYTRESLLAFMKAGLIPDYIQIGNEITNGMLWPDGQLKNDSDWIRLRKLLQTCSLAVRQVVGRNSKTIVHITSSTDWSYARWFFDQIMTEIDFDIIGLSYYPFWHGKLGDLHFCLDQLFDRYNKSIFIVETGYPWERDLALQQSLKNITGFDETPEGQVHFIRNISGMLADMEVKKKRATGLLWWAAEYVTIGCSIDLGRFDRQSFFDSNRKALPILRAFGQLGFPARPPIIGDNPIYGWNMLFIPIILYIIYSYRKYSNAKRDRIGLRNKHPVVSR
jgi:arabinogalactan endo-1,4-beta-galactosidase